MPAKPEPTDADAVYTLEGFPAAAIRFVRALERNRDLIASDHGVSPRELSALFHIGEVRSSTPKELASRLEVTTGAVTSISSKLVSANLVQRIDHPTDRRSFYLQLTPEGHNLMARIHREFLEMIAASTAGLTPQQVANFEASLHTVSEQITQRTRR